MKPILAPNLDAAKQFRAIGEARRDLKAAALDLAAKAPHYHPTAVREAAEAVTNAAEALERAEAGYRAAKDRVAS